LGAGVALLLAAPRPPMSAAVFTWCTEGSGDLAIVRLATIAAWACLAWVTVAAFLTVLTAVPGMAGLVGDCVARALVPIAMRRALEAALGITVAAFPVLAAPAAWAEHRPPAPTWSPPPLDRPATPQPHRAD